MKNYIRHQALALGFDAVGFTTAEPPASQPHYAHWIAAGKQGAMGYLERGLPKRGDLSLILPGIKSVICLAASYPASSAATSNEKTHGVIARYARGKDYHEVLGQKLEQFVTSVLQPAKPASRSLRASSPRC